MRTVSPEDLNDIMDLDHVIRVNPDGTIDEHPARTHPATPYAPEAHIQTRHDGQIMPEDEAAWAGGLRRQGWEPERGWSGQDRYRGAIMHPSEFVGGNLARHVAETPGLWVAVVVDCLRGDLTESTCAACGVVISQDPDTDIWEDPQSGGGADGRRHCPDTADSLHVPDHDPDECGCEAAEQESENAGWAVLHMDDGPETDSYVLRPSNGRPVPVRADLEGYAPMTLAEARAQIPFWNLAHFAPPRIIRVTDLAVMPNEE